MSVASKSILQISGVDIIRTIEIPIAENGMYTARSQRRQISRSRQSLYFMVQAAAETRLQTGSAGAMLQKNMAF